MKIIHVPTFSFLRDFPYLNFKISPFPPHLRGHMLDPQLSRTKHFKMVVETPLSNATCTHTNGCSVQKLINLLQELCDHAGQSHSLLQAGIF